MNKISDYFKNKDTQKYTSKQESSDVSEIISYQNNDEE